jgi:hypothetical protein
MPVIDLSQYQQGIGLLRYRRLTQQLHAAVRCRLTAGVLAEASHITPNCDHCTCSMCVRDVPLGCIWKQCLEC